MASQIVNGPSKWDLMLGLMDNDIQSPRRISFTLSDHRMLDISLTSLEREDGSGQSWNFFGMTKELNKVKGHFDLRTRKGSLEFQLPF